MLLITRRLIATAAVGILALGAASGAATAAPDGAREKERITHSSVVEKERTTAREKERTIAREKERAIQRREKERSTAREKE